MVPPVADRSVGLRYGGLFTSVQLTDVASTVGRRASYVTLHRRNYRWRIMTMRPTVISIVLLVATPALERFTTGIYC